MSRNEAGTLTCPSCYKITDCTPSQLPRHLKAEHEVLQADLKQSGESLCGTCEDDNMAEAYCPDCVSPICSDCVSSHKRLKLFKAHNVMPLKGRAISKSSSYFCSAHPTEILKYYCSTCEALACSDCLLDHTNHICNRLANVACIERAELESISNEVHIFGPVLSDAIKQINVFLDYLNTNSTRVASGINGIFDTLISLVEKRRKELLHDLDETVISKKIQLEIQKESLQSTASQLQLITDSCASAISDYSDAEALAVKKFIQKAAKQLVEEMKTADTNPVTNCALTFEPSEEKFVKTVATLGIIHKHSEYAPLCGLVDVNPSLGLGIARGQESFITLQTRDRKGENLVVGGANVKGEIHTDCAVTVYSKCVVTDADDGTYEIRFTCDTVGEFVLEITVNDVPTTRYKDSRQRIVVRDYARLNGIHSLVNGSSPFYVDIGFDNTVFVTTGNGVDMFSNEIGTAHEFLFENRTLRGIAVDTQSEVMFLLDQSNSAVYKVTMDGETVASVGPTIKSSSDSIILSKPMGLCLTRKGLMLICNGKMIIVLDSDFSLIRSISCLDRVWGVSIDPAGNLHAAVGNRVEVFNIKGKKICEYGRGHLERAVDVAFLKTQCHFNSYSFVSDYSASSLLVFDWMSDAVVQSVGITQPLGVAISQEGLIYVCNYQRDRVFVF